MVNGVIAPISTAKNPSYPCIRPFMEVIIPFKAATDPTLQNSKGITKATWDYRSFVKTFSSIDGIFVSPIRACHFIT